MTVAIMGVGGLPGDSNTSIENRALRSSERWGDVGEPCDEVELGSVYPVDR